MSATQNPGLQAPQTQNFDSYNLDIGEFMEHVSNRQCDCRVIVQEPIDLVAADNSRVQAQYGDWLYLAAYDTQTDVADIMRPSDATQYRTRGRELHLKSKPHMLALLQVLAGNRWLIEATRRKELAKMKTKRDIGDFTFKVNKVHILTHNATVRTINGEQLEIPASTTFDVGRAQTLNENTFYAIRFGEREQFHAVLTSNDLNTYSTWAKADQQGTQSSLSVDLTFGSDSTRRYFLVTRDFDALDGQLRKLPLSRGQTLFMNCSQLNGLSYCTDGYGRNFVVESARLPQIMEEIKVAQLVHEKSANYLQPPGADVGPKQHVFHNDQVDYTAAVQFQLDTTHLYSHQELRDQNDLRTFPRTKEGMPMPPAKWIPGQQGHEQLDAYFGSWKFFSEQDQMRAHAMGLETAQEVVMEAVGGNQNLGDIMLQWSPGELDPVQSLDGSAYWHILEIDRRRKFWFGRPPLFQIEIPVYTGTDPYAHERPGAPNTILDQLRMFDNYNGRNVPTEQEISQQVLARQGYLARSFSLQETAMLQSTTTRGRQMQEAVLTASNRDVFLYSPFECRYPINSNTPPGLRTSFHPSYVHVQREEEMHESNYLLHRHKEIRKEIYAGNNNSLAILPAHTPLLNASGEMRRTLVQTEKHKVQEVLLEDYPFLPQQIAADEDPALLYTFSEFSPDGKQIPARMDEQVRPYWSKVYDTLCYLRWDVRFIEKNDIAKTCHAKKEFDKRVQTRPVLQAHYTHNTLRGVASGKIDPDQEKDAVVVDVTGKVSENWIEFPSTTTHPKQKIESHIKNLRKAIVSEREEKIKEQSG